MIHCHPYEHDRNLRVLLFAKPVGPNVQSTFLFELLVFDWTGQCDSLRLAWLVTRLVAPIQIYISVDIHSQEEYVEPKSCWQWTVVF
jgi:hypothetical protein